MATIKHCMMRHETGTKFYELICVGTGFGTLINIRRWGKINTAGQTKIVTGHAAIRDYTTTVSQKMKRGYRPIAPNDGRPIVCIASDIQAHAGVRLMCRIDLSYAAILASMLEEYVVLGVDELHNLTAAPTITKPDHSDTDPEWGTW